MFCYPEAINSPPGRCGSVLCAGVCGAREGAGKERRGEEMSGKYGQHVALIVRYGGNEVLVKARVRTRLVVVRVKENVQLARNAAIKINEI